LIELNRTQRVLALASLTWLRYQIKKVQSLMNNMSTINYWLNCIFRRRLLDDCCTWVELKKRGHDLLHCTWIIVKGDVGYLNTQKRTCNWYAKCLKLDVARSCARTTLTRWKVRVGTCNQSLSGHICYDLSVHPFLNSGFA
jgi:hypothetical protein